MREAEDPPTPVSSATFYRERNAFTTPEVMAVRRGKRAAYQERPRFFSLDQTTPRHGERPFAIAHLDHTQLDIELVSSLTSKPLARSWLTFLTDAYSRRILATHVSYEEPSYRGFGCVFSVMDVYHRSWWSITALTLRVSILKPYLPNVLSQKLSVPLMNHMQDW